MRRLDGINDAMDLKVSKLQGHSERQGHLECCSSRGCKELDTTDKNSIRQSERVESNHIHLINNCERV